MCRLHPTRIPRRFRTHRISEAPWACPSDIPTSVSFILLSCSCRNRFSRGRPCFHLFTAITGSRAYIGDERTPEDRLEIERRVALLLVSFPRTIAPLFSTREWIHSSRLIRFTSPHAPRYAYRSDVLLLRADIKWAICAINSFFPFAHAALAIPALLTTELICCDPSNAEILALRALDILDIFRELISSYEIGVCCTRGITATWSRRWGMVFVILETCSVSSFYVYMVIRRGNWRNGGLCGKHFVARENVEKGNVVWFN